jgi:asparagine synthase (glutamine-hydrolysing)
MSGLFGIVGNSRSDTRELLMLMGQKMSHRPWHQVETFYDESQGIGLGRIGIGIFNKASQPTWNSERTVALMMAGELYNDEVLAGEGQAKSAEQIALALYEQRGEDFINRLKGAFIMMIWDQPRRQLLIVNDRFGLYPLYYAYDNGRLIFAPEMKGLLCDTYFHKKLDITALAEYTHFQHLLGDKTFFEGLKLLPHASLLRYDLQSRRLAIRSYWDFSQLPQLPLTLSFDEAAEEASRLLQTAVKRLSQGNYRFGMFLSGGLDSRAILGAINPKLFPLTTVTFGQQGCRDVVYAQQLANLVGAKHHYFEFTNGKWVEEFADFHLELTEGFHSWIHSHGMSILAQVRPLMDINLTGFAGDTFAFSEENLPALLQASDDTTFTIHAFLRLTRQATWPCLNEVEKRLIFSPRIATEIRDLAFESFCAELNRYNYLPYNRRYYYFYFCNISRRMYQYYTVFQKSHFELRFPFCDYDYFEFAAALPAEVFSWSRLRPAIVLKINKSLARVPYDKDNLPITQGKMAGVMAQGIQKSKSFINRNLAQIFPEYATLYADYENWLRNELRAWGENILLGEHTIQRDIYNPEFLRSLWLRHLSGREEWTIGKIAPIMTYEMMLRRFYD